MMITIHGLPVTIKFQDLKILIKQECKISDFILDCLVNDVDGSKKVRVGLADDAEGSHLIKCLDGYRMSGNVLRLIPVGKSAPANIPQQNTFDMRDNYQARNEYPNQGNDRNSVRSVEAVRPAPWAPNNQWSNQALTQIPSNFNYQQQPINTYGQAIPAGKPQYEARENLLTGSGARQAPGYGYNTKSNLISIAPQRNIPSTLREIPETPRQIQSNRYPSQNYDIQTVKPVTIMKDNFQGATQYNMIPSHVQAPGSYQAQSQTSWTSQKQYDKPPTTAFEKKSYDDRKYQASQVKPLPETTSKPEDQYKGYDKLSRQYSPHRGYGREMATDRINSPSEREISHSGRLVPGRRSPERRISPSGRPTSYSDRRSPGRRISPERRGSPPRSGRNISPSRRLSPSATRMPQTARHISPSGRPITTERRTSPHGRRFSPSGRPVQIPPVRQISPGRKSSPPRKISPSRRISPSVRKEEYMRGKRISPPTHSSMDRRVASRPSPSREAARGSALHGRHESPRRQGRYSPSRHHMEKNSEFQDERRSGSLKNVRPAYEPPSQASDEAMYSGGYRHNVREEVQYPVPRQDWQDRDKGFAPKSIVEDRRDVSRMQKFDIPRVTDQQRPIEQESKRSRSGTSRSPRRDRSPIRDRYKRHSPSPLSPRRSWALEKRRSPEAREAPPPPAWPGKDVREDYRHQHRPKFYERDLEKSSPIWETKDKKHDNYSSVSNRRDFEEQIKARKEVSKWKPLPQSSPQDSSSRFVDDDRLQKEPKFSRKDFEGRRDFNREEDIGKSRSDRVDKGYKQQDREDIRYNSEYERKDDIPRKKVEYAGRIEEKKKEILQKQEQLQKEIDEVYKRAVDFTKKAEMYRKGELKKETNYDSDRRRNDDRDPKEYELYKPDSYDDKHSHDGRHSREDTRKEYSKSHPSRADDVKKLNENQNPRFELDEAHKRHALSPTIKTKRNKAIDEISEKMLCKYGSSLPSDVKKRVLAELKWTLGRKLYELFGEKDVSFIEMVIKFNARHSQKDEEKIFEEVLSGLPSQNRSLKRSSQDDSDVPAKSSRGSTEANLSEDLQPRAAASQIPDWNIGMLPHNIAVHPPGIFMRAPVMVPLPTQYQMIPTYQNLPKTNVEENRRDGYNLYLCKDDFQPIMEFETNMLKDFLIQQMIVVTQTSQGWAPDFTLNKVNCSYRHEVIARDERSRDWLLSLDFSDFKEFNVLVYTTEELWYERAAIWLPGHSRCRNIEPLQKLKLQNKRLEGVNIGKWKLVKKIVIEKGTRLYVDMPPSSARALEKHKMQLSFELQKVNVFLKAVAIDKDAFDAGLNEPSISILPSPGSCPMPSIGQDPNLIKIACKGNKPFTVVIARKLKDLIIYRLFKYHQLEGKSRTDFIRYGLCQPGFLGIVPENEESRKWIASLDMGKINRQPIVIVGAEENKTKFFKMIIKIPKHRDVTVNAAVHLERLRQSNKGLKGINFNIWRNHKLHVEHGKAVVEVEMDLESVDTISKMNYQLDYVEEGRDIKTVTIESRFSRARLMEMIAKSKAEMSDKYDVANMDLASSDSESEIIFLD